MLLAFMLLNVAGLKDWVADSFAPNVPILKPPEKKQKGQHHNKIRKLTKSVIKLASISVKLAKNFGLKHQTNSASILHQTYFIQWKSKRENRRPEFDSSRYIWLYEGTWNKSILLRTIFSVSSKFRFHKIYCQYHHYSLYYYHYSY